MRHTLLVASVLIAATVTRGQVEVTYIANEGFLLEGGGKKVLVDALFDGGVTGYPNIPETMRPKLEGAKAPFDGVDLVLTTHEHADHFGPRAVVRHLTANGKAHFLSTPRAAERVRARLGKTPEVRKRVHHALPDEGKTVTTTHGGVKVRVLRLHHGRGRNVRNLGFLIELGGLKLLHVGDTEVVGKEIAPLGLAKEKIDVALLPAWLLTYPHWRKMVRDDIKPRAIVVMHMPVKTAPASYFGSDKSYAKRVAIIRREFPKAKIFEKAGESATWERKPARPKTG